MIDGRKVAEALRKTRVELEELLTPQMAESAKKLFSGEGDIFSFAYVMRSSRALINDHKKVLAAEKNEKKKAVEKMSYDVVCLCQALRIFEQIFENADNMYPELNGIGTFEHLMSEVQTLAWEYRNDLLDLKSLS